MLWPWRNKKNKGTGNTPLNLTLVVDLSDDKFDVKVLH